MAEIALIFHWTPADMDPMPVAELMDWRARAIALHNQMNKAER